MSVDGWFNDPSFSLHMVWLRSDLATHKVKDNYRTKNQANKSIKLLRVHLGCVNVCEDGCARVGAHSRANKANWWEYVCIYWYARLSNMHACIDGWMNGRFGAQNNILRRIHSRDGFKCVQALRNIVCQAFYMAYRCVHIVYHANTQYRSGQDHITYKLHEMSIYYEYSKRIYAIFCANMHAYQTNYKHKYMS